MRFLCLATLVLISCGPTSTRCADTCAGCCDSSGACQFGTEPLACGSGGDRCLLCTTAQTCSAGLCLIKGTTMSSDAGTQDAGSSTDAGSTTDAGATKHDAGMVDGGTTQNDAGTRIDGGTKSDAGVATGIAAARAATLPAYIELKGVVVSAVWSVVRSTASATCAESGTSGIGAAFWVAEPNHPTDGLFVSKFRCNSPPEYEPAVGDVLDLSGYIGRQSAFDDVEAHRVVLKDQYDFLSPPPVTCTTSEGCTPLIIVKKGTTSAPSATSIQDIDIASLFTQARPDLLGARITLSNQVIVSGRPLALKRLSAVDDDVYRGFLTPAILVNDSKTAGACDYRQFAADGGLVQFQRITGIWESYAHAPCLDGGTAACVRASGQVPGTDAGFTHVLYPLSCADLVQ